jgi:hypothetical protein
MFAQEAHKAQPLVQAKQPPTLILGREGHDL